VIDYQDSNPEGVMAHSEKKSALLMIVVSWIVVLIPLGWGVFQSMAKSVSLFHVPAASKAASTPIGK
jgi:hypothetical protein